MITDMGEEVTTMTKKDSSATNTARVDELRPRTQARGQARRRQIIETATSLFAASGFNKVSFADISKEVGISQAGVLHYFPSKADLLLEVLKHREGNNAAARAKYIEDGARPLDAHVRTLFDNDSHPELVQLFVVLAAECAAPEHPGHGWFSRRNDTLYEWMIDVVRELIDEAKLPAGVTVQTVTRWLVALPQGLGAKWIYDTEAFDRAGTFQLFIRILEPYMKDSGT